MRAFVRNGKVKLFSRNGDSTARFNFIAENDVLRNAHDIVEDGEVFALDERGRPCFQCLQDQLKMLHGNALWLFPFIIVPG
jgi:bifunctional non-homologous end joining protein LigD